LPLGAYKQRLFIEKARGRIPPALKKSGAGSKENGDRGSPNPPNPLQEGGMDNV